jgi:TRAP-type mannitol/chloroaromatic compound transport system permease small subunit
VRPQSRSLGGVVLTMPGPNADPATALTPIDRLSLWLGRTLAWVFLIAVALTAWEVLMRYVLNSPTIWVHDLVIALSALAFIFGGSYALQRGEHIRISSLYDRMPLAWRRGCDLLNALAVIFFMAAFGWAACRQAWIAIEIGETSGRAWDVPIPVVIKSALAAGVVLMILQAIVNLARTWRQDGRQVRP